MTVATLGHNPSSTYSSDAPVSETKKDAFGRVPFAQRIANTIAARQDATSLVIGIYGTWGQGKTSVLNFIAEELDTHSNVVHFTFDPWRYGDETALLHSYFAALANALKRSLTSKRQKLGKALADYATLVSPTFSLGPLNLDMKAAADALASSTIEDERAKIESILMDAKKRIVVLVDDIDRLDRSEIQAVFKLLKLTANFPYTAYVLAFDEMVVAASLAEQYADRSLEAGHDYLEKIVQVPLHLPVVDRQMLRIFCLTTVFEILEEAEIVLTEEQRYELLNRFEQGLFPRLHTPRDARRFANALNFALPLMKNEVNPVDQILIEGVRVFYPQTYEAMRTHPDAFLRDQYVFEGLREKEEQRTLEIVNGSLGGLSPEEKTAARSLLTALFPRLSGLFGGVHHDKSFYGRWASEQRVASPRYFPRFVGFTVPASDVPDQMVTTIVTALDTESAETIEAALRVVVTPSNAATFISKLAARSGDLVSRARRTLAIALALTGDLYPVNGASVTFFEPFRWAARMIQEIIYSLDDAQERASLARETIERSTPTTFLAESIDQEEFTRKKTEKSPDTSSSGQPATTSYLADPSLRARVAARLRTYAEEKSPLFVTDPDHVTCVFRVWAATSDHEVDAYVREILDHDPSLVYLLVRCYQHRSTDLTPGRVGLPGRAPFDQTAYDSLESVMDTAIIYDALQRLPREAAADDNTLRVAFEEIYETRHPPPGVASGQTP